MERRERQLRQSSLPSTLFPFLMQGPGQPSDISAGLSSSTVALTGEGVSKTNDRSIPNFNTTFRPLSILDNGSRWISRPYSNYQTGLSELGNRNDDRNPTPSLTIYSDRTDQRPSTVPPVIHRLRPRFSDPNLGRPGHFTLGGLSDTSDTLRELHESDLRRKWEAGPSHQRSRMERGIEFMDPQKIASGAGGLRIVDRSLHAGGNHGSSDSIARKHNTVNPRHETTVPVPRGPPSYEPSGKLAPLHATSVISSTGPPGRHEDVHRGHEIHQVFSRGANTGSQQSNEADNRRSNHSSIPVGFVKHGNIDGCKLNKTDQKRSQDPEPEDIQQPPKKKVPKKAPIACDFCRGRKLRCDTTRPTCGNCIRRKISCIYQLFPRRRGPGKAPKGTQSKRRSAKQDSLEPSSSQPPLSHHRKRGGQFDIDSRAAELRSKDSVASMGTLSSQIEGPPPPYTSIPHVTKETSSKKRTKTSPSASSSSRPLGGLPEGTDNNADSETALPDQPSVTSLTSQIAGPPPYTSILETTANPCGSNHMLGRRASLEERETQDVR